MENKSSAFIIQKWRLISMSIKYHQYGIGNEYGDDHMLTDN